MCSHQVADVPAPVIFKAAGPGREARKFALFMAVAAGIVSPGFAQGYADEFFDSGSKAKVLNSIPPADRVHAVDVGSRVISPDKKSGGIAFEGGRAKMYLQFTRPITAGERGAFTRLGVHFHEAVGGATYLVTIKEAAFGALQGDPLVRGFEPLVVADKMTRAVFVRSMPAHAVSADGKWNVHVRFFDNVPLDDALAALDAAGVETADRSRYLLDNRLLVKGTPEQVHNLGKASVVRTIVPIPAPPQDDNVDAAAISNTDVLQAPPFNLLGAGVNIGHWEGGQVNPNHVDMVGRVTLVEVGSPGDHATHVAGTMIGDGSNNAPAMGMAPAANLFSWLNDGDVPTEMSDGLDDEDIRVANHSWGISDTTGYDADQSVFGPYDASARGWDVAIRDSGLIVCNSSGNDNDDTDGINIEGLTGSDGQQYHTIDSAGNSKNNITVGSVQGNAVTIVASSSTGPTDDGRVKPNVVANGDSLLSTSFDATNPGNNAFYEFMGGTSMATPTVAGNCALLVERWRQNNANANPAAETIKALIIHTAVDLGIPGPDNTFGYGLLDAEAALGVLDMAETMVMTEAVDSAEVDEYLVPVLGGSPELKLTAVWTDEPGSELANPALVNNLNLEVEAPDGTIYYPFTGASAGVGPLTTNVASPATTTGPNLVDNVEQIIIENPMQGFWKARMIGDAVPEGPQNYTLITNIGFLLAEHPNVEVNAPLDFDETCIGKKRDIVISVFNTGGSDLLVDSVAITGGAPHYLVLGLPSQPIVVKSGAHVDYTVRYQPTTIGPHAGALTIATNDPDEPEIVIPITGEAGTGEGFASIANAGSFGNVCVGSFHDLALTISNNGGCGLRVVNITSSDPQFIPPTGTNAITPAAPRVIASGVSLQVPVRFQPALPFGAKSGTVTVVVEDPLGGLTNIPVAVTGNTPAPVIDINPCPIEFGHACLIDPASRTKTINICNTGLCPLTIPVNGIRFDPATTDFVIVNAPTYPLTIAPGSECYPLTIKFTPTGPGLKTATLVVDGEGGLTKSCSVSGSTEDLTDMLQVPDRLGFQPTIIQADGPCGTALALPIQNVSQTCGMQISAITIVGADAANFTIEGLPTPPAFPVTLAPGELLGDGNLTVKFSPTEVVTKRFLEAELQVTFVIDPTVDPAVTTTKFVPLAGEACASGARILVTLNGVPVEQVLKLDIKQLGGRQKIMAKNVLLKQVSGPAGFVDTHSFPFHAEFGGMSAPNQRLTGNHKVTAQIKVGKKKFTRTVNLSIDSCDFNNELIINF